MTPGTTSVVVARGHTVLTRDGVQGPGTTLELPAGEAALLVVRGFVLRTPTVAPDDHHR